jgi:dipeptidyl aminopeptidase/acylaminoacyl peptidase
MPLVPPYFAGITSNTRSSPPYVVIALQNRPGSWRKVDSDGAVSGGSEGATQEQMIFVDVATGAERVVSLAALGGEPQGLVWLDSESLLANHSAQGGAPEQLWRLSSTDGRLSRLTNDLSSYFGLSVGPDRTTLVTMRSEARAGIWLGDGAAAGEADIVAPAPFSGRATLARVAWLGENLLYGTASGRAIVARVRTGLGMPEELVSNALEGSGTPDGRTVVYRATEADREGLWKVNADGRQPEQLVPGQIRSPVVFPNGRFVGFLSSRRGALSPWIVSIDGGEPMQVTTTFAGEGTLDISPDSKTIVFTSRDDQGGPLLLCAICPPARRVEACLFSLRDGGGHLTVAELPTMTWRVATSGFTPSTARPVASSPTLPTAARLPILPGRTTASV